MQLYLEAFQVFFNVTFYFFEIFLPDVVKKCENKKVTHSLIIVTDKNRPSLLIITNILP
jgi:hypothetical protein